MKVRNGLVKTNRVAVKANIAFAGLLALLLVAGLGFADGFLSWVSMTVTYANAQTSCSVHFIVGTWVTCNVPGIAGGWAVDTAAVVFQLHLVAFGLAAGLVTVGLFVNGLVVAAWIGYFVFTIVAFIVQVILGLLGTIWGKRDFSGVNGLMERAKSYGQKMIERKQKELAGDE